MKLQGLSEQNFSEMLSSRQRKSLSQPIEWNCARERFLIHWHTRSVLDTWHQFRSSDAAFATPGGARCPFIIFNYLNLRRLEATNAARIIITYFLLAVEV